MAVLWNRIHPHVDALSGLVSVEAVRGGVFRGGVFFITGPPVSHFHLLRQYALVWHVTSGCNRSVINAQTMAITTLFNRVWPLEA